MSKFDRFGKSSNPMFNTKPQADVRVLDEGMIGQSSGELMTVNGAVNKTFILFGIMLFGAGIGAMFPMQVLLLPYAIAGAIVYFITSSKPSRAPSLAPLYAVIEGLLVGTISVIYAAAFDGIVVNAASLTFAILFMMLALYKSGLITVSQKFRAGVSMAVGAVMLLYLVNIVLYMFGISIPFLHDGGPIAIGVSGIIIVVASMNLLLDFDNFEKGEGQGAPQYMEWYYGMGLLFTLIWLYLEILRFLSFFMGDD